MQALIQRNFTLHASEITADLSAQFDIPLESFKSIKVTERTELTFTLKPLKDGVPPPYDISSLAYRIQTTVKKILRGKPLGCVHMWMYVESNHSF